MKNDSGMAFVLIRHSELAHASTMADLLSKYAKMRMMQAR